MSKPEADPGVQPALSGEPTRKEVTGHEGTQSTADAPPFRAPAGGGVSGGLVSAWPPTGQTLDDFDLVQVLGTGAFGRVYLARQVSLGRLVALKVSRNQGQEGRTMAPLEHEHIVRVFSEVVVADRDLRLLCMQYVPGTTLERIIAALRALPPEQRGGRAILDIIDRLSSHPATLDIGALRDREALGDMDGIEASCWMGARLAEGLAHAHGYQVLHRDIKPANVLVNRYGRPLLADFNIATPGQNAAPDQEQVFGGTLAYMSPEHLDAFNRASPTRADAVGVRSDIYSLGVLLFELLTGQMPFVLITRKDRPEVILREMADQRRAGPPRLEEFLPEVPAALERTVARCLAGQPEDRFPDAADLASALDSCRQLRRLERDLPQGDWLTRWCQQSPFLVGGVLILLPQVIGTIINITYNFLRVVLPFNNGPQTVVFNQLVIVYNLTAWPICVWLLFDRVTPVVRTWRQLKSGGPASLDEVTQTRRRALTLPRWAAILACIGWFPGALFFPLGLHWFAGKIQVETFTHFLVSFTVSGLIALTYSVLAVEFLVLRVLYPGLWLDARHLTQLAREELRPAERRLTLLQVLAVLIPLTGAVLMVGVGPDGLEGSDYTSFRLLVTALLAVGMGGLGLVLLVTGELRQMIAVLVGGATQTRR